MKPAQTVVALLGIVAIVFGVAYLLQFYSGPASGTGGTEKQTTPAELHLTIPSTVAEWPSEQAGQFEVSTHHHRDFWVHNPHDLAFKVGIESQSCKCGKVELVTFPTSMCDRVKSWLAEHDPDSPVLDKKQAAAEDKEVKDSASLLGGEYPWKTLHREASDVRDPTILMPPRTSGLIRIGWEVKKSGPERVSAVLWSQPQTGGTATRDFPRLEIPFFGLPPLIFDPIQESLNDLMPRENRQVIFWCFSGTKDAFDFDAEIQGRDGKPDPCITVKVRPMTPEERAATSERAKSRCQHGYRVQVDVHERISETVQLDLGPFRRRLTVKTPLSPDGLGPTILGTVRGDVVVGSDEDKDRVALKSFAAARGTSKEVLLSTEPGVELDEKTLEVEPAYLKAGLTRDRSSKSGLGATWLLKVEVPPQTPPGSLNGLIAIQVKTPGNPFRRIRIPVAGTAYR